MTKTPIILFGGAFNPPHLGHQQAVAFILSQNPKADVWIIPSFSHPYSKNLISYEDSLQLCELNFLKLSPRVKISRAEEELPQKPSYTFDLISYLKKKYPEREFIFAIGSDCKKDLERWHRYDELIQMTSFFFIPRAGFEESTILNISSSEIREKLSRDENLDSFLDPEVIKVIREKKLF